MHSLRKWLEETNEATKLRILSFTIGRRLKHLPSSRVELVNMGPPPEQPASSLPANELSKFLSIPFDVRRLIYYEVLPEPKIMAQPRVRKPTATRVGHDTLSLLTVNKKISEEVTHVLYQETIFRMDVTASGIAFLHHPLMPVDIDGYNIDIHVTGDVFMRPNMPHGFNNIRHLDIAISGADSGTDWKFNTVILRAILHCLVDIRGNAPLNTLKITLSDSDSSPDNCWWDSYATALKMAPFFNTTVLDFITQPLRKLRNVQHVEIDCTKAVPERNWRDDEIREWQQGFIALSCSDLPQIDDPELDLVIQKIQDTVILWQSEHGPEGGGRSNGEEDDKDISGEIIAELESDDE
ncbi:MAG: hypothetical protein M1822_006364 [Bathelium mastoideum]|nr:MAG: hypothetical protein M1822_006364 [Bathelium mastoideum]